MAPGTEPTPPPAPTPVAPAPPDDTIRPLQTYRGDIESLVQKGGVSQVSIAAAEALRRDKEGDKKEEEPAKEPAEPGAWHRYAYWGLGATLVVAATGLVAVALMRQTTVPVTTGAHTAIILVDETTVVPITGPRLGTMAALVAARDNVQLSLGLIERLYLTAEPGAQQPAPYPVQELLALLAPTIPPQLLRTLEDEYLLAVHSYDRNQALLLMRADSYDVAYRGMLEWETSMYSDLTPLFARTVSPTLAPTPAPVLPAPTVPGATTTSTTTPAVPPAPAEPEVPVVVVNTAFVDRIVENRDIRAIVDPQGAILLLWTFIDRYTLLVATNEATLREVVARMATTPIQYQPQ